MKVADPGGFALKGALRAGVVMPLAFALGDVVIGNPQVALFAAFGSIAILVFVEFGGSMRARLGGYVGLALAGTVLIPLGTLCSHSTALGASAMFVSASGSSSAASSTATSPPPNRPRSSLSSCR